MMVMLRKNATDLFSVRKSFAIDYNDLTFGPDGEWAIERIPVGCDGGSAVITLEGNLLWSVSGLPDWLSADPSRGSSGEVEITITAAQYRGGVNREATFYIGTLPVTVTQTAYSLSATPTSIDFTSAGGTLTVTIDGNAAWALASELPQWLSVDPSTGPIGETILSVTAEAADSSVARSATILINGTEIAITQPGYVFPWFEIRDSYPSGTLHARFRALVSGLVLISNTDAHYTGFENSVGPFWHLHTDPATTYTYDGVPCTRILQLAKAGYTVAEWAALTDGLLEIEEGEGEGIDMMGHIPDSATFNLSCPDATNGYAVWTTGNNEAYPFTGTEPDYTIVVDPAKISTSIIPKYDE